MNIHYLLIGIALIFAIVAIIKPAVWPLPVAVILIAIELFSRVSKVIVISALLLGAGLAARAQTITNTEPTVPGLVSTFGNWVGSYDTNLTFQDIVLWDGPVYQNGVNFANELGVSVDLWKQKIGTNNVGLASVGNKLGGQLFQAIEGRFRQASIGGLNLSEAGGIEFGWTKYDFRAGVFGDCVYLNRPEEVHMTHRVTGEFGAFADKMLSKSSAVGIFISQQIGQDAKIIGANLKVSFGNGTGFLGLF
jgi:hypothetical protein